MPVVYPSTPEGIASLAARFWAKVNKEGPVPEHAPELGPCWIWTAHLKNGYGRLGVGGASGEMVQATHVAYFLQNNSLPPAGMYLCHKCDNPACVRHDHLFVGSQKQNLDDMISKGRAHWITHPEKWAVRREKNRARGERVSNAALNTGQVLEIRDRLLAGERCYSIARNMGISVGGINAIMHGETWRHVISDSDIAQFTEFRMRRIADHRDSIKHMVELRASGLSCEQIATITGFTASKVSTAISRHHKRTRGQ